MKPILLLIDGSALMHRAYHAMPDLTDRQGRPTGALYGFVRMLLKAIKDLQPQYVAVAFDRLEPTFRKQLYIAYQAQRPEADPELGEQFVRIRELLNALEISVYDQAGYEADDIIGTIATQVTQSPNQETKKPEKQKTNNQNQPSAISTTKQRNNETTKQRNTNVIILTSDKDLMQLVNQQVKLYLPIKGVTETELVSPLEVEKKLGVPPQLVIDYKGLVGDPSDNYPGVTGIGPKTAVKLLQAFGSFTNIYQQLNSTIHSDLITQSLKDKLIKGRDSGQLSQELAKIRTDVKLNFSLDDCQTVVTQPGKLARTLEDFGFTSLVRQLGLDQQTSGQQMQLI